MSAFDIPTFAELTALPPKPVVRSAPVKRGANPKKKPGPRPGELALKRGEVDPRRVPPPTRNWKGTTYVPPLAMRMAMERAHEAQPAMISLAGSTTDGHEKKWGR